MTNTKPQSISDKENKIIQITDDMRKIRKLPETHGLVNECFFKNREQNRTDNFYCTELDSEQFCLAFIDFTVWKQLLRNEMEQELLIFSK